MAGVGCAAVVAGGEGDVAAKGGGADPRIIEQEGAGGAETGRTAQVVRAAIEGVAPAVEVVGAELNDARGIEVAEHAAGAGAVAETAGQFEHADADRHIAAEVVSGVGQGPAAGTVEVVVAGIGVDGERQLAAPLVDHAVDGVAGGILTMQHEQLVAVAIGEDVPVQHQRAAAAAGDAHRRGAAVEKERAVGAVTGARVFQPGLLGAARQAELNQRTGAQRAGDTGILEVVDAHRGDLRRRADDDILDVVADAEHPVPRGAAEGVVVHAAVAVDRAEAATRAVVVDPQEHIVAKHHLAAGLAHHRAHVFAVVQLQRRAAQDVKVLVIVHRIFKLAVDDHSADLQVGVGDAGEGLDRRTGLVARRLHGHRAAGVEDEGVVSGHHAPEVVVARALEGHETVVDDVEPVRLAIVEHAGDDEATAPLGLQDSTLGTDADTDVVAGVDRARKGDRTEPLAQQRGVAAEGVVRVGVEVDGVGEYLIACQVKAQVGGVAGGRLHGDGAGAERAGVGVGADAQFRGRIRQAGHAAQAAEVAADHGGASVGVVAGEKNGGTHHLETARAADGVGDDLLAAEAHVIGNAAKQAGVDDDPAVVDHIAPPERTGGRRGRQAADKDLGAGTHRQAVDLVGGIGQDQAACAAEREGACPHRLDAAVQGEGGGCAPEDDAGVAIEDQAATETGRPRTPGSQGGTVQHNVLGCLRRVEAEGGTGGNAGQAVGRPKGAGGRGDEGAAQHLGGAGVGVVAAQGETADTVLTHGAGAGDVIVEVVRIIRPVDHEVAMIDHRQGAPKAAAEGARPHLQHTAIDRRLPGVGAAAIQNEGAGPHLGETGGVAVGVGDGGLDRQGAARVVLVNDQFAFHAVAGAAAKELLGTAVLVTNDDVVGTDGRCHQNASRLDRGGQIAGAAKGEGERTGTVEAQ